jgi:YgiT-type zinc finger domain-containing protein
MDAKDCPLCGTAMKLKVRQEISRLPGRRETRSKQITEWVCPDCDYFEDVNES